MKRKYPASYFFLGLLQNMFRYGFLLVLSLILIIIGFAVTKICLYVGVVLLVGYLLLCIIEQIVIMQVCLKKSDNEEVNEVFDNIFGDKNEHV